MSGISILLIGTKPFELLSRLANLDEDKKHYIHYFNLLDFGIPLEVEDVNPRFYRSELQRAFRLLKEVDTSIPNTQLEQLRKYDLLELEDIDLEINAWIQQVFDNKGNYDSVSKFLSGEITKQNVEFVPLVDQNQDLVVFKGNKLSPIRYYVQTKELNERFKHEFYDQYAEFASDDLEIHGHETLDEVNINEESLNALHKSDYLVILASDVVSLGTFSKLTSVLKNLRDAPLKTVLIFPSDLTEFKNFAEEDVFELLELGGGIAKMIDNLSNTIDYIISPNQENSLRGLLLESGYQIETEDLDNPIPSKNNEFIEFLNSLSTVKN